MRAVVVYLGLPRPPELARSPDPELTPGSALGARPGR
jgi:hypothetical protein